ncbi:aminoglycoside phosphotransferase [Spongiactinospora sp. TRM90649]|uniref:aminoglycoside phosphotransferase n=1 Tax=Spongiactinospora sp. TRM90649 TaxID=3031114 RepID=UPI0023F7F01D|nr:aminoglycoside phosphotransferase [Spongiactinospora sp. TRM90649]MDF5751283.1 aminoglycoside phosphotransferase [Spongiactinospora sp. TRM90649]
MPPNQQVGIDMTSRHRDPESGQRAFLRRVLAEGADRLGVTLTGDAVFGWHDRTIGSACLREDHRLWLRATAEHCDWAHGEGWTGNQDATAITGVPKPVLISRAEWEETPVLMYAELLTHVADEPCSTSPELTRPLVLPASWWADLREAVDTLAAHSTPRGDHDPSRVPRDVEAFYGRTLDFPEPPIMRTEHTDLHWANLTQPRLWLLDWEYWGNAPAGYGAAVLYLHSLLVPATAAQVYDVFVDVLDTPTGRLAQLSAAAHILHRAEHSGDYPTLAGPVRTLADRLMMPARRR